jgi:hypothetical protein
MHNMNKLTLYVSFWALFGVLFVIVRPNHGDAGQVYQVCDVGLFHAWLQNGSR